MSKTKRSFFSKYHCYDGYSLVVHCTNFLDSRVKSEKMYFQFRNALCYKVHCYDLILKYNCYEKVKMYDSEVKRWIWLKENEQLMFENDNWYSDYSYMKKEYDFYKYCKNMSNACKTMINMIDGEFKCL